MTKRNAFAVSYQNRKLNRRDAWMNDRGNMVNPSGQPTVDSKPVPPEEFPGVVIRRSPRKATSYVVWVQGTPKHEFSSLDAACKHVMGRSTL